MSTQTNRDAHPIDTVLKTYETALNGNDIDTILGLYGDTPIFMPQHAPALIGRDAVRAGYAQVFDTIKLSVRFDIHEVEEAGDWAWARTSSTGRTRILSSGAEIQEGNNELFVFRREKGAWKIHRYLFSTSQPPRA
jgi:ketosteroid isomerase-like protein